VFGIQWRQKGEGGEGPLSVKGVAGPFLELSEEIQSCSASSLESKDLVQREPALRIHRIRVGQRRVG
jgi:hypothetical protein